MSAEENNKLKAELDGLLQQGAIVPSYSTFSAPVLFVKKKYGSLRICVDYSLLNERTIRNGFSLPVIDDLMNVIRFIYKLEMSIRQLLAPAGATINS